MKTTRRPPIPTRSTTRRFARSPVKKTAKAAVTGVTGTPISPHARLMRAMHLGHRRNSRATVQRDYFDLSDTRIPANGIELGERIAGPGHLKSSVLHIFAHSAGETLREIEQVGDRSPEEFAKWLARSGAVFNKGDADWSRQRAYKVYIHACASKDFARDVKAVLVQLNTANDSVTVYGTEGISATHPTRETPIVIPMEHTKSWEKFEEKLKQGKARKEEIREWNRKWLVFPNGYQEF